MANVTLLNAIQSQTMPESWVAQCISKLNSTSFPWSKYLVDGNGNHMSAFNNNTWGITVEACYDYCNASAIPWIFNFQSFSSSILNYFLPWLALTAQLPFETGDPWNNAMAFCLAVGSPALVTYSLTITILNRFWVRRLFKELIRKARTAAVQKKFGGIESRIRAAQFLLQEAQQVPLRASQEKGWLSSLIVIPDNSDWWKRLETRISGTRRGVTQSFVAQMGVAVIAYLLTIISSFLSELGNVDSALQLASGSLWIWLLPVIAGWITVGTQFRANTVTDALADEEALLALAPPDYGNDPHALIGQRGLMVRPGLSPVRRDDRAQTVPGGLETSPIEHLRIPTWLGAEVGGDEQLQGPIFNYARPFTFWELTTTIKSAFFNTLESISNGKTCHRPPAPRGRAWSVANPEQNLVGDFRGTAEYCGLLNKRVLAYPEWSDIPSEMWRRIIGGGIVAIFLQWGTAGASILIAYLTPTVGLGCRSSSYIMYAGLSTFVWLCLLGSMLLSHEVMLRYQAAYVKNPSMDFRLKKDANNPNPNQYTRSFTHASLCAAAVILRYIGKSLAVLNTVWLIVSSLMEFVGGYNNCWCQGNAIGLGSRGWIVLFKGASDLAARARLPWAAGLTTTVLVCAISYFFFYISSTNSADE